MPIASSRPSPPPGSLVPSASGQSPPAIEPSGMSEARRRLGVLISGRGSNLQAIIDAIREGRLDASVAVVISNRPDAPGLARAREAGIEALCLNPRDYAGRDAYDRALAQALADRDVALVCLAGFMRLVGPALLDAFPHRIL